MSRTAEDYLELGKTYWAMNGKHRSESCYAYAAFVRAADQSNDNDPRIAAEALAYLGEYYLRHKYDAKQAKAMYRASLNLNPANSLALTALSERYIMRQREDKILRLFDKAILYTQDEEEAKWVVNYRVSLFPNGIRLEDMKQAQLTVHQNRLARERDDMRQGSSSRPPPSLQRFASSEGVASMLSVGGSPMCQTAPVRCSGLNLDDAELPPLPEAAVSVAPSPPNATEPPAATESPAPLTSSTTPPTTALPVTTDAVPSMDAEATGSDQQQQTQQQHNHQRSLSHSQLSTESKRSDKGSRAAHHSRHSSHAVSVGRQRDGVSANQHATERTVGEDRTTPAVPVLTDARKDNATSTIGEFSNEGTDIDGDRRRPAIPDNEHQPSSSSALALAGGRSHSRHSSQESSGSDLTPTPQRAQRRAHARQPSTDRDGGDSQSDDSEEEEAWLQLKELQRQQRHRRPKNGVIKERYEANHAEVHTS